KTVSEQENAVKYLVRQGSLSMIGMLTDRPPGGIFLLGLEHSSDFSYTTTLSRPCPVFVVPRGGEAKFHSARNKNLERLIVSVSARLLSKRARLPTLYVAK